MAWWLWLWPVIGAALGCLASYRRGFSTAQCVTGGLLLGPLAVVLFLVPVDSSVWEKVTCPYCANRVMASARVCQQCGAILGGKA